MRRRTPLRSLAWLAFFAIAPGIAGPGAIVATLSALASFGGDPTHHVSMQSDAGHDDIVFCHDEASAETGAATSAFAPADCSDDHRLHATNDESLISRDAASQFYFDPPLVLAAAPLVALASVERDALPGLDPAALIASRQHRSIVLRI